MWKSAQGERSKVKGQRSEGGPLTYRGGEVSVGFERLLTSPVPVVPHANGLVVRAAEDYLASSGMELEPPHPVVVAQLRAGVT